MSLDRFSRRRLLESIGGAALFLPLLHSRRGLGASPPTFPKRIIILQTSEGTIHDSFWPKTADATAWQTDNTIISPLKPYRDDIILMGGIEMRSAIDEKIPTAGGYGHHSLPHLLTASPGAAGRLRDGRTDPIGNSISVDQFIANAIKDKAKTPFRSLEVGALVGGLTGGRGDNDGLISFNGKAIGNNPARPNGNLPEESPYKVRDKLLTAGPQVGGTNAAVDPAALARAELERKTVLDFLTGDLSRMKKNLGEVDRMKLDSHLDGLQRLNQELGTSGGGGGATAGCSTPVVDGAKIDLTKASSMPAIMKAQMDLVVAALACDLTRVVTFMACNGSNENLAMTWLGAGFDGPPAAVGNYTVRDHHNLTHAGNFRPQKIRAEQWFCEQLAYLIGALKKVPEGNGTMLDNTVVWYANHMDDGDEHRCVGMPWILAGSCGGYFKTGRYQRYGDWAAGGKLRGSKYVPHNGLLVGLCNAMDAPPPNQQFGDPKYGTGELAGLHTG